MGEDFPVGGRSGEEFLAIFRNEITTILTPSTSEGGGKLIENVLFDSGPCFDINFFFNNCSPPLSVVP